MALTYRFYRSTRIGDGLTTQTAFRSVLSNYIVEDGTGKTYQDLLDLQAFRYALVRCESALHATVSGDPGVLPLSPECPTAADIKAWLDTDPATLPANVRNRITGDGFTLGPTLRATFVQLLLAVRTLLPPGS